ncbi:MAG: hypothetical protein HY787_01580 [Deltaproteobacteria bacterium]|nr:hypothetical protein [Deltaproteobacteria bacterium]
MEQTLNLTVKKSSLPYFFPLFQQGIIIKTLVGGNIQDFLSLQLEIPLDYLENRIQTIFLDGKAVDNLGEAVVRDGSTLALSAAMPGLVGATLRRGGAFASLRQAITFSRVDEVSPQKEGWIILKLFNLLVSELGPRLLSKGIWLKGEDLNRFLGGLKKDFWAGCRAVVKNGKRIDAPFELSTLMVEKDALFFLKVEL